ncbi:MAG: nucleotidyltransferase domain-containing protein, partial [Pseudoxanthomonas suwonensis]|nr:nucleotidyltransferase domain-containing protein [Pseudoxanthomonas suwonensis]
IHRSRSPIISGPKKSSRSPLKKYFYALRPLLAVRWLESSGTAAPIEFERLLEMISDHPTLLKDIHSLLDLKRAAPEMGLSAPVPSINEFIESELARLESIKPPKLHEPDRAKLLNVLFQKNLREQS